jgi:hypothetical protein
MYGIERQNRTSLRLAAMRLNVIAWGNAPGERREIYKSPERAKSGVSRFAAIGQRR